jgi:V8-like Glu-specific endopeptidase
MKRPGCRGPLLFFVILGSAANVADAAEKTAAAFDRKKLQQVYVNSKVHEIAEIIDGALVTERAPGIWWDKAFPKTDTRHVQFSFDEIRAPPGLDFRIEVWQEGESRAAASYEGGTFARRSSFVTDLLPPGIFHLRLIAAVKPVGLRFRLAQASWQYSEPLAQSEGAAVRYRLVHSLAPSSPAHAVSHAIALVHISKLDITCTGVLIAPDAVATNHHCAQYSAEFPNGCADVKVEFDYLEPKRVPQNTDCKAVIADAALDLALFFVDPKAIEVNGTQRAAVTTRPASEGTPEDIAILHHPLGLALQFERSCGVRGTEGNDLLHDCYTHVGSSGAPLFDQKMRLVGLHYEANYPEEWSVAQIAIYEKHNEPRFHRATNALRALDLLSKQRNR